MNRCPGGRGYRCIHWYSFNIRWWPDRGPYIGLPGLPAKAVSNSRLFACRGACRTLHARLRAVAEQFAEIGVIWLLFGVGLRFHLRELMAVWRVAIPGALIQSALSTTMLAWLLHLMGWSWVSGFILGIAISVASTVVMALVLTARHDLHAPIGHIAIGWTVVEDLLTVALLLLLPIIFGQEGSSDMSAGLALGLAALKVVGLVAVVVVLGRWVIPWALERIDKTRSREIFTLSVLVLAVGIAVGSGWNALVATSIISIALNPTIYRLARKFSSTAPRLARLLANSRPLWSPIPEKTIPEKTCPGWQTPLGFP